MTTSIIINCDHTTRATALNNTDKLAKAITDLTEGFDTFILSEVVPTAVKKIALPEYDYVTEKLGYDHLALAWNQVAYTKKGPHFVSREGKYVGILLEDNLTEETLLLTGVHHPHKQKKKEARRRYTRQIRC
eukprot:TRINITY_DN6899_c0_g1_i1.p1 TRINITY_DN6899_c0_g1~~TRINITY_DN6899_c0_g1_i1.p1  ORF type:complete len:132 (+),score=6.74 TRINITY_DN6899_c0_g1_i1:59-454(+)